MYCLTEFLDIYIDNILVFTYKLYLIILLIKAKHAKWYSMYCIGTDSFI